MAEVILAQNTSTDTTLANGDIGNHEYQCRQSFTLDAGSIYTITRSSITWGANNGSPSGQTTLRIETDNGSDAPSGTLAHANFASTWTPTASSENVVDWTDTDIAAGKYWLVLNNDAQSTNVYWNINANGTSGYAGGHAGRTYDGTYQDLSPMDTVFKVYGIITAAPAAGGHYMRRNKYW